MSDVVIPDRFRGTVWSQRKALEPRALQFRDGLVRIEKATEGRRLARDTEGTKAKLRKELVQVAAICVAWLESDCNAEPEEEEQ